MQDSPAGSLAEAMITERFMDKQRTISSHAAPARGHIHIYFFESRTFSVVGDARVADVAVANRLRRRHLPLVAEAEERERGEEGGSSRRRRRPRRGLDSRSHYHLPAGLPAAAGAGAGGAIAVGQSGSLRQPSAGILVRPVSGRVEIPLSAASAAPAADCCGLPPPPSQMTISGAPSTTRTRGSRWRAFHLSAIATAIAVLLAAGFLEDATRSCHVDGAFLPTAAGGGGGGRGGGAGYGGRSVLRDNEVALRGGGEHQPRGSLNAGEAHRVLQDASQPADLGKVVGGREINIAHAPYQASIFLELFVNDTAGPVLLNVCAGTLIDPEYIISAAHCFVEESRGNANLADLALLSPNASSYIVRLGSTSVKEGLDVRVKNYWLHPEFRVVTSLLFNDVSLFRLERPVPINDTIMPVKLAFSDDVLVTGSDIGITGWGDTTFEGDASTVLLGATVDLLPDVCPNSAIYKAAYDPKVMLCAGCREGGVDGCQGDSGGPATTSSNSTGCPVLVGITSFGGVCGSPESPGVYTRVATLVDWVEKQAGRSFRSQYPVVPTKDCQLCGRSNDSNVQSLPCGDLPVPSFDKTRCKLEAWMSSAFKFRFLHPCSENATSCTANGTGAAPCGAQVEAFFDPGSFGSFTPTGSLTFLQGRPGGSTKITLRRMAITVPLSGKIRRRRAVASKDGHWRTVWAPGVQRPERVCSDYYAYAAVFITKDASLVQVSYPVSYSNSRR
ncbi:hypothetical protein CBR_g36793 [Chara braunii]|uniref:Peptidase S1 domain-containing protein n=1 Tax=Chara braunii TaxID=69332 RepID=A0A388LLK5_CHABU|nr:hypothetical protein CBR_g36793 [Chara braunii]|eukprot:GBG83177.1 hypothetical protein CBR_g36793 [Chara braunii]